MARGHSPRHERLILELRADAHDPLRAGMAASLLLKRGPRTNARARSEGDAECKYWIHVDRFDITDDFEYNCTPRLRREVRQVIFEHFDQIVTAWHKHFGGDRGEQDQAGVGKGNRDHARSAHCSDGSEIGFDSVGKVFGTACPRIPGRTRPRRTFALRLRNPLALDR